MSVTIVLHKLRGTNVYYIVYCGILCCNATIYVLFNNWFHSVDYDRDVTVPSRSRLNLRNFLNVIVELALQRAAGKFLEKKDENC